MVRNTSVPGRGARRNTPRSTARNTQSSWDNTNDTRIRGAAHDEYLASLAAREGTRSLGDLVSGVVQGDLSSRLSRGQRAAHAWFEANGDLEARHTCGVYVRDSRVPGAEPVLGVYVDTNARLTDMRANKDIYLARLANVGLAVADIEFRLSRTRKPMAAGAGRAAGGQRPSKTRTEADLPPLTPEEERHVAEACRDLPDGLRQSASRAMSLSIRQKKSAGTQKT